MLTIKTDQGFLPLENRINFSVVYEYEGEQSLFFDLKPTDTYYPYIKEEMKLRFEDNDYLIKGINQRKNLSTINATLDFDDWKKRIHKQFDYTNMIFSQLLTFFLPQGWTIEGAGSVIGHKDINVIGYSDYQILMECKKIYGIVYEYHIAKKMIKIVHPDLIQPRGLYMSDELNLESLEFKGSSSDFTTRLYAYGKKSEEKDEEGNIISVRYVNFADINNGKDYVDNQSYCDKIVSTYWQDDKYEDKRELLDDAIEKLKVLAIPLRSYGCKLIDLSRVNPKYQMLDFKMYDKPLLIDHRSKITITHQIVQYKRFPDNEKLNEVTLSTDFKNIVGTIDGIKQSISGIDTELKKTEYRSNEIIRDVASNTALIKNTYTKGETETKIQSAIQQSEEEISLSIQQVESEVRDIASKKIYRSLLTKSASNITKENESILLIAQLMEWDQDVSSEIPAIAFKWKRSSNDVDGDTAWNANHQGMKSIQITSDDLNISASFGCEINVASGVLVKTSYETIIDETDLSVPTVVMYSNMPPNQLYDPNEKTYYPSWENMSIYPIIRLNGLEMSLSDQSLSIVYKRKDGVEEETNLLSGESVVDNVLTITKDMLSTAKSKILTYIIYLTYKGKTVSDSISFSLISEGAIGEPGTNAMERYQWIQYADSENGTNISASPQGKKYLGVAYNKTTLTPSTNPKDYAWSLIQGAKGDKGDKGDQGLIGGKGADGTTFYTWLKYADTPTTGMSDDPLNKKYIGLAYNKSSVIESTNYADYTWSLVKGDKGDTGAVGGKGSDGKTLYTWIKYASSSNGTGMSDDPLGKTHIGLAYNKLTDVESNIPTDYTWSLIKGDKGDPGQQGLQGIQGIQGLQGIQGAKGADGKTTYFHIKYSAVANPTTSAQMSETPNTYIGTYVDTIIDDSNVPSVYTWARFQGLQGATGTQGIPGTNGADGKTTYLHIKYSNDGGKTFTSNAGETVGTYMGTCTDQNSADPTLVTAYTWALIKGDKGDQGAIGETLSNGKMLYRDPVFATGINSLNLYNNSGNGNVTVTRIEKQADCPTESQFQVEIKNIGTSSPLCGGFNFIGNTARANAVFIYRIIAKLPIGRNISFASNATGDGGTRGFLTSTKGTGKYEEYLFKLVCGATGTFSTTGYFVLDGAVGTVAEPVKWYVAYATCFDMTGIEVDYVELIENTKQQITTEYSSAINQTKQQITQSVEEVRTVTDTQSTLISSLSTQMEMTTEATSFIKTTVEKLENTIDGKVDNATIQEWARFNGSTLELGASNSPFKAILTNTELAFWQGNMKVAWISNNELHIANSVIMEILRIGNWQCKDEGTAGLTWRRV